MNKDNILAMSRTETQGAGEYYRHVLENTGKFSVQAGLLVCCSLRLSCGKW